ncbi:hypothetical protein KZO11_00820 [Streptomyces anulatus]|uniref:hypothetical protein n=1 Tax=Streptomyces anulatus TaxID=1892 RepID=UPI001C5CD9AC|nr:hypothetical protein [Streptomyces anulatus]QYA99592.1 hypothetical protein KZO11_00820 [Streptomyces anulatus]
MLGAGGVEVRVGHGIPFGAGLRAADCVVLPAACLDRPIADYDYDYDYDRVTLTKDLTAHLLHGLTITTLFTILQPAGPFPPGHGNREEEPVCRMAEQGCFRTTRRARPPGADTVRATTPRGPLCPWTIPPRRAAYGSV